MKNQKRIEKKVKLGSVAAQSKTAIIKVPFSKAEISRIDSACKADGISRDELFIRVLAAKGIKIPAKKQKPCTGKRRVVLWLPEKLVSQVEICGGEWNGQTINEFTQESIQAFVEALIGDIKLLAETGRIPGNTPGQRKVAKRLHRALLNLEGSEK